MKNKNILVLSHMYPRRNRDNYGVFVSEQVRALKNMGIKVSVISPTPLIPAIVARYGRKWQQYRDTEDSRMDFDTVSVFFPRYISIPRKFLRSLAVSSCYGAVRQKEEMLNVIKEADVVVAHTALFDGRLARKLAKKYDKDYYVYIHGEDLFQNTYGIKNIIKKHNISKVLRDAKGVITVSEYMKKSLDESYGVGEKTYVVHNGVDLDVFKPADKLDFGKLSIISASFLIPRKGQEYLLRAMSKYDQDFKCEIGGDGPEREKLETLTKELGIDAKVNFTGSFAHKDFPKILSNRNLFILPSWDEAFGVVYIEAMAMGLPVVAANDAGAPDIITDGVDGYLVPPRNTEALLDVIAKYNLLSFEEKYRMSQKAIERAREFTWESNANKLSRIFFGGQK